MKPCGIPFLIDNASEIYHDTQASKFGCWQCKRCQLVFFPVLAAWTTCALPVTPLEVCAGFVFGPIWGTMGSLFAKTMGCCCALIIGRLIGRTQGWKMPQALEKYLSFLLKNPLQVILSK
jgi:uncharacterized membrane protein YdjX (TVP38/TMEM64 family)